jgi:hypothetical protein
MSEVDRLSNSGLYPALPIADRQRNKDGGAGNPMPDPRADKSDTNAADHPETKSPRPPKSLIDEYA